MRSNLLNLCIIISIFLFNQVNGQSYYIQKQGDPNGINKWYMGRQIAQVMSHFGIEWLEREEREFEERTSLLLKNLELKPGLMVADIGAGSGYHSRLISSRIGSGKVYAVDIEPVMLEFIEDRNRKEGIQNIKTVLSTETSDFNRSKALFSKGFTIIQQVLIETKREKYLGFLLIKKLR